MKRVLVAAGVVLASCGHETVLGLERQLSIAAISFDAQKQQLLQGGYRYTSSATEAGADLWYGRASLDGGLSAQHSEDLAGGADAVAFIAKGSDRFLLVGHTTAADGAQVAWARVIDDADAEVWTVTLPGPAGTLSRANAAVAMANGDWLLGGTEVQSDGSLDGWVARLAPDGVVRWRAGFARDFQQQARTFQVFALSPLENSQQQLLVGGQRIENGVAIAGMLQMTLTGELWDSNRLTTTSGTVRGVFTDVFGETTACLDDGSAFRVVRITTSFEMVQTETVIRPSEGVISLASCTADASSVWLSGTQFVDGQPAVPVYARLERSTFATPDIVRLPQATSTRVLAFTLDGAGGGYLAGRTDVPLRRWQMRVP